VEVNPPDEVAELILSRKGFWPFPEIVATLTTPTLRPDGTILFTEGYDPATRLYLIAPPPMPDIAAEPTEKDAREALAILEELIEEFPFIDEPSRSVALSALITPVIRGGIPTAPLHAFSAPEAGTGKSFIVDIASTIATGFPCPAQAIGRSEEEFEKRLAGALLSGYPILNLDNIAEGRELAGDFLCQVLERPLVEVRPLGTSKKFRLQPRLMLYGTGNNLCLGGDVVRRSVRSRIDSGLEDPTARRFRNDPLEMVARTRGRYVAAILTICRAYIVAGRPSRLRPFASFETWSDLVRSSLVWLGQADPCETTSGIRDEDPRKAQQREVFAIIATQFGREDDWRVADLLKAADTNAELKASLLEIAGRKGEIDANRVGQWLRRNRDRVVAGMRLVQTGVTDKKARWRLRLA
jgi:putative DNA primase/helicase